MLGLELRLLGDGQLRFFDAQTGEYLPNYSEQGDRAERERERAERLAAKLKELGIDPSELD
ncbi:MAG TPA: hypothetical protein VK203_14705 [Nostocaceae cyanobacterium]|nr:hypothetical protein [Nostocaceae cyanobacterium]